MVNFGNLLKMYFYKNYTLTITEAGNKQLNHFQEETLVNVSKDGKELTQIKYYFQAIFDKTQKIMDRTRGLRSDTIS